MNRISEKAIRFLLLSALVIVSVSSVGISVYASERDNVWISTWNDIFETASGELVRVKSDEINDAIWQQNTAVYVAKTMVGEEQEETDLNQLGDVLGHNAVDYGKDVVKSKITGDEPISETDIVDVMDSLAGVYETIGYDGYDASLVKVVAWLGFASELADKFGGDGMATVASLSCGTAADMGTNILNSRQYKEWLVENNIHSKWDFKKAFWKSALSGIGECLADIPNELKSLAKFMYQYSSDSMKFLLDPWGELCRYYANNSFVPISFGGPAPTVYGSMDGPHVVATWGTSINDLDVHYYN